MQAAMMFHLPQKSQHQFGIGFTHDGIAGDSMQHFATAPGVDPGLAEIVALELPDQALGERLLFFEAVHHRFEVPVAPCCLGQTGKHRYGGQHGEIAKTRLTLVLLQRIRQVDVNQASRLAFVEANRGAIPGQWADYRQSS